MNIKDAIDQSGFKDNYLAKYLGMDDALFSQKKLGWRGRKFNEDQTARLAKKMGMIVKGSELYPDERITA